MSSIKRVPLRQKKSYIQYGDKQIDHLTEME